MVTPIPVKVGQFETVAKKIQTTQRREQGTLVTVGLTLSRAKKFVFEKQ